MTNQNEQNVQNTTEQVPEVQKKEQIVHWGVKLPVSLRDRLAEMLADWKTDPTETQAMTVEKLLDAAQMAGHEIPEEVQKTTGETREAVMVLLKRINSIGASAALTVDDLHNQLKKQIDANTELQEKYKEDADKLNEQHKALVDQLKEQLKSSHTDSAKLAEDYSQLKESIGGLKDANAALQGQNDDLKARQAELKEQLKSREQELEQEKAARKTDQTAHEKALKDQKAEYEKSLADAEKQAEADREDLKKELEKLAEAKKEAQIAQAVGQKQAELYDKFSSEKQRLNDEKADLKAQIAVLKTRNEALQKQLDQQVKKPETEGKGK